MKPDEIKAVHSLISYFQSKYLEKFGKKPLVNRNKVKYLLYDVIQELSVDETKKLINSYIAGSSSPSLTTFCYEYDSILLELVAEEEDFQERRKLLKQTQARVEQFRKEQGL